MIRLPMFMVIGAIKAGTTSLHRYLQQHPDVFLPERKEPRYFAYDVRQGPDVGLNRFAISSFEEYQSLFLAVAAESAVGEASPQYLWSPVAPVRIKEMLPDIKMIAILRNPVDRAFSSFLHLTRDGVETHTDFGASLSAEEGRIREHCGPLFRYKEVGFYSVQLERYFSLYDRDQIRVFLYEDLQTDPKALLQSVFELIGVDAGFEPDLAEKHNVSGIPKSRMLQRTIKGKYSVVSKLASIFPAAMRQNLASRIQRWNVVKPEMSSEVRRELRELFRSDILRTQELIDRDLSEWQK